MEYGQTYTDEQGYERPTNPPEPQSLTLTPETIVAIFCDMGLDQIDAESFIVEATRRGTAT